MTVRKPVSRPRDPQVGMLGARPLPPRLDPRAGRPPRPETRRNAPAAAAPARRPAARDEARGGSRRLDHDAALDRHPEHGFGRTLGMTVVGALLPGTGFLAAGLRQIGWTLLAGLVVLVALGAWLATSGKHIGIRLAVSPTGLMLIIAAAVGLAIVWALVVIAQYRVLAPDSTSVGQHLLGSTLVVLLALGVAAPAFEAAHLAAVQRNLITGLFGDDVQSATVPEGAAADPWGSKD